MHGRFTFDRFEIDADGRRLTCEGRAIAIAARHLHVLVHLVSHAGSVVSKDALVAAGWPDVAVTDNSLEQAISTLRRLLGPAGDGSPHIQTIPRQGYRFTTPVTKAAGARDDAQLDALLDPHRAWLQGRASLETLTRDDVEAARLAFGRALATAPDYAPAHVGAANAFALQFQSTRTDASPDVGAIAQALVHARAACRLEGDWAEAWATLAFVLHSAGHGDDALAAARRAVMIEADNWRHLLRLALVSWGEERLRAAQRTLVLLPDLALAHWLAATVHVARQSFDAAEHALAAGATAQDAQHGGRFAAVGLHWLRGMVLLRRGDVDGAQAAFARELEFERSGHVYARECCANVWYARAAIEHRCGCHDRARAALEQAIDRAARHPLARAAAGIASEPAADVDTAHAAAIGAVLVNDTPSAARILEEALSVAPPGVAGWTIPVDPWLRCADDPAAWTVTLACVRNRAA